MSQLIVLRQLSGYLGKGKTGHLTATMQQFSGLNAKIKSYKHLFVTWIAISFSNLVSNIHEKYKIDKLAPLKQNRQKSFA